MKPNLMQEIAKLGESKQKGLLTEEEFSENESKFASQDVGKETFKTTRDSKWFFSAPLDSLTIFAIQRSSNDRGRLYR